MLSPEARAIDNFYRRYEEVKELRKHAYIHDEYVKKIKIEEERKHLEKRLKALKDFDDQMEANKLAIKKENQHIEFLKLINSKLNII